MSYFFDPGRLARLTPDERQAVIAELNFASMCVDMAMRTSSHPARVALAAARDVVRERQLPDVLEAQKERATIIEIMEKALNPPAGLIVDDPLAWSLDILNKRLQAVLMR